MKSISRLTACALIVLYALIVGMRSANAADTRHNVSAKIDNALAAGVLSHEQAVLYKVYSIRTPEKIPAAYRPEPGVIGKSATPIILEALRGMSGFSPATQAALDEALTRPANAYSFDSPDGYFKIHFDSAGVDAVPLEDLDNDNIPDYVERVADYADSSWRHQVNRIGWRQPPSDGTSGGDSRYDVYTETMPYYGYTDYDGGGPELWNDYISYIVLHNNFIGFPPNMDPEGNEIGAAKVTMGHEFNHACQMACDGTDEFFFYELSAVYAEELCFDEVNDCYNYLGDFFSEPYVSLREYSNRAYATFPFGLYLHRRFGTSIMPEIWEYIRFTTVTLAIDSALMDFGSTTNDEFPVFSAWSYLTGSRDDGFHHEEAAFYPMLTPNFTWSTYPAYNNQTSYTKPQGWAANYIRYNPGTGTGKILQIDFNGQDYVPWGLAVIGYRAAAECEIITSFPDPITGNGVVYMPFYPDLDYIVSVPTNLNPNTSGANYQITASLLTPGDLNEDHNINPVDVIILVNYVYKYQSGIEPEDYFGDCNCDGMINPVDVVVLVQHVYKVGPEPCSP